MIRNIFPYMIPNPVSVSTSVSLTHILQKMQSESVSHLIVMDDNQDMVGIISKADLLVKMQSLSATTSGKAYTSKIMESVKAKDIMVTNIISLKKEDPIEYATELLLQKQFHCLPVVEDNKAIGIITFYDLLKAYYEETI
jgi:CBS domain-containing protein